MGFIVKIDAALKEYREKTCIVDQEGTRATTYEQFDELSGKVAEKLKSLGVKKNDAVIISQGRVMEYIAAEYGVLRLGAVAIPIIPSYPEARVAYIQQDSGAKLILTEDFFADIDEFNFNAGNAKVDYYDADLENDENDVKRLMIYTSGSTGNPKGVVYRDRALCAALIRNSSQFVRNLKPLVYGASATMSFTVTITEYYRNMSLGGLVHIISEDTRKDVAEVEEYYAKHNITMGFLSPRMLKVYKNKDKAIKMIGTGSERVVNTYSDEFFITNGYGQTETVGCVCSFKIDKEYENTPVGKPLEGITIKLVDEKNEEVPYGEEGFIVVVGDLPYEYNNLEEQTKKTFERLPDGLVAVHTGDRGRLDSDGNLIFVNRNDWMLKIHGQRVEPGEIEAVMNKTEGVTASVAKGFEQSDGSMLLCGFYTGTASESDVHKNVEDTLPHYMVPSVFIKLDKFPINANGKVDRMAIEKPDLSLRRAEYEAPVNELESKICDAMSTILNIDRIGRNDDFFELGGNSINSVMLAVECGIEGLSPMHIMLGKTPKGMVQKYNDMSSTKRPAMVKADSARTEFKMTNSQKYQLNECDKIGSPVDSNDFRGFWKLDEKIDIDKLAKAIIGYFADSQGMQISFDREKKLMYRTDRKPQMNEYRLKKEEFEEFRRNKARVIRDLSSDELYEIALVYVEEDVFLYININHLLYDESSLNNMIKEIEARYENRTFVGETTDVFDLSTYEESIKESDYFKAAVDFHEKMYFGITSENIPPRDEKQDSVIQKDVAPELDRATVEKFLVKNGVSEIIYLQTAFALALSKTLMKNDQFTYMVVYDGRIESELSKIKGVLAKSVYMHIDIDKEKSIYELLNGVLSDYQKLLFFDTVDSVEMTEKYPNIKNDIYLNFRGTVNLDLHLGDSILRFLPIGLFFEGGHVMTRINFLVDFTKDKHYIVRTSAGYNNKETLQELVDEFEKMLVKLVEAEQVSELF